MKFKGAQHGTCSLARLLPCTLELGGALLEGCMDKDSNLTYLHALLTLEAGVQGSKGATDHPTQTRSLEVVLSWGPGDHPLSPGLWFSNLQASAWGGGITWEKLQTWELRELN